MISYSGMDKMCVPKLRFYKKWNFSYNKAFRHNQMSLISKMIKKRAEANQLAILNSDNVNFSEKIIQFGSQHGLYSDFCNNSPVDICNGKGTCESTDESYNFQDYLNGFVCKCDQGWGGFTCDEPEDCEGSGASCNSTEVKRKRDVLVQKR